MIYQPWPPDILAIFRPPTFEVVEITDPMPVVILGIWVDGNLWEDSKQWNDGA